MRLLPSPPAALVLLACLTGSATNGSLLLCASLACLSLPPRLTCLPPAPLPTSCRCFKISADARKLRSLGIPVQTVVVSERRVGPAYFSNRRCACSIVMWRQPVVWQRQHMQGRA